MFFPYTSAMLPPRFPCMHTADNVLYHHYSSLIKCINSLTTQQHILPVIRIINLFRYTEPHSAVTERH
jgi:hypothetical protein